MTFEVSGGPAPFTSTGALHPRVLPGALVDAGDERNNHISAYWPLTIYSEDKYTAKKITKDGEDGWAGGWRREESSASRAISGVEYTPAFRPGLGGTDGSVLCIYIRLQTLALRDAHPRPPQLRLASDTRCHLYARARGIYAVKCAASGLVFWLELADGPLHPEMQTYPPNIPCSHCAAFLLKTIAAAPTFSSSWRHSQCENAPCYAVSPHTRAQYDYRLHIHRNWRLAMKLVVPLRDPLSPGFSHSDHGPQCRTRENGAWIPIIDPRVSGLKSERVAVFKTFTGYGTANGSPASRLLVLVHFSRPQKLTMIRDDTLLHWMGRLGPPASTR
ncbi:hypothetical protein C8R44DRAFT_992614 [Mycena epipterygia]|nr:hypothetical protein C8R44DRAFT_992614 [Mycena epipterygia]